MQHLSKILTDAAKQMVYGKPGLPTGYPELDDLLSGLKPGNLIVIAARPSMGKSSLMLNIAANVAKGKSTAVIFTLEMSSQEVIERLIGSASQINIPTVKRLGGKLPDPTKKKLLAAIEELKKYDLHIEDGGCAMPTMIMLKLDDLIKEGTTPAVVFVDYVQLMGTGGGESRQVEIGLISQQLKALAKKYHIPVVLLSQLNRQVEARPSHLPQLSDLRDSGSLEQDADSVIMIYRPGYYGSRDTQDDDGEAILLIKKNRNGPTGRVPLLWKNECATFFNLEDSTCD